MNPKKIDLVDYLVMALYSAIGVYIYVIYTSSSPNLAHVNMVLFMLTFAGSYLLFFTYSKRFRIPKVWFIWLAIGTVQAILVIPLRNNIDFTIREISSANSGLNLLLLLAIIPIFRRISRKVTNQEFDVASRFLDSTKGKLTPLDYLLTLVGIVILTLPIMTSFGT